jgi:hypothetical protein
MRSLLQPDLHADGVLADFALSKVRLRGEPADFLFRVRILEQKVLECPFRDEGIHAVQAHAVYGLVDVGLRSAPPQIGDERLAVGPQNAIHLGERLYRLGEVLERRRADNEIELNSSSRRAFLAYHLAMMPSMAMPL